MARAPAALQSHADVRRSEPDRRTKATLTLLLLLAVLASIALRWRFVEYNLPAASHVDERRGLDVMLRFAGGTLDPGFFYYPTFVYYLVFGVSELLGGPNLYLPVGRALNLLITGGLGVATFWLGILITGSGPAALTASLLMLGNSITAESASYLSTDPLAALLTTVSLALYIRSARDGRSRDWMLAMACAGFATSAKYNAAILVFALLVSDFLRATRPFRPESDAGEWLNQELPTPAIRTALLVSGLSLAAFATLTPMSVFSAILERSGELNSVTDSSDFAFIRSRLRVLFAAGVLSTALAALSFRWPKLLERFRPIRLYAGAALAFLAFAATSPFTVLSWRKFIYDFGSQLKVLAMLGEGPQWLAYPEYFAASFGWIVALATITGMLGAWKLARRDLLLPVILLLILYYAVIGRATLSFPRYLLAILPILSVFAAWGLVLALRWAFARHTAFAAGLALLTGALVALHMAGPLQDVLARTRIPDEMHASLHYLGQVRPDVIYYAGFVPDAELRLAGHDVRPVREADLRRHGVPRTGVSSRTVLVVDWRVRDLAELDTQGLVWQDARGFGQFVYRPALR